jgi:hypothetical protein
MLFVFYRLVRGHFLAVITAFELSAFQKYPVVVWTGHIAGPAAHAFVVIHQDNSVVSFVGGSGGAHPHARRIYAMIAENRDELLSHVGIFPGNLIQDLGVHDAGRCAVFCLARDGASLTPNAAFKINYHSVMH